MIEFYTVINPSSLLIMRFVSLRPVTVFFFFFFLMRPNDSFYSPFLFAPLRSSSSINSPFPSPLSLSLSAWPTQAPPSL